MNMTNVSRQLHKIARLGHAVDRRDTPDSGVAEIRPQCHSGQPFELPGAAAHFASQTEIEAVEVVARLEPVRGSDRERRQVDVGTHLVGRDGQAVAGAQETVAEKAADAATDKARADFSAIQQAGPEKLRGLVRRDLTAEETGRRDQKCVLPAGGRIEKWAGQNRTAVRTGPKIGRRVA